MTFVTLWSPALPTDAAVEAPRPQPAAPTPGAAPAPPADPGHAVPGAFHALVERLLTLTPHLVADPREGGTLLWADARGLDAPAVARSIVRAARRTGMRDVVVGVSRIAIVAELAARVGASPVTIVPAGEERAFLADQPLARLVADGLLAGPSMVAAGAGESSAATSAAATSGRRTRALLAALADVGIDSCGELARLTREAVEVRFGADGSLLWRLARADDERLVFRPTPRGLPAASLEWLEFELRDPERLIFVANRLAARICGELQARGETARAMTLTFALADGGTVARAVRGARPTADRATWLRLVRAAFERIELPDAVRGLTLCVEAAQPSEAPQGDLFDAGFQTGAAGEAAIARLVDDGLGHAVRLSTSAHALPEQRAAWRPLTTDEVARSFRGAPGVGRAGAVRASGRTPVRGPAPISGRAPLRLVRTGRVVRESPVVRAAATMVLEAPAASETPPPGEPLALRLLPEPRSVAVTTRQRRGYAVPVRYRERLGGGTRARRGMPLLDVVTAAGPDRVAVGQELGAPVAREYWQCLTGDGQLVLLFHDVVASAAPSGDAEADDAGGVWYLHGWWD